MIVTLELEGIAARFDCSNDISYRRTNASEAENFISVALTFSPSFSSDVIDQMSEHFI